MDSLRAYILSVVASSVICACVQLLIGRKGTSASLIKMLCGIYMAFVLIAPLQGIDFSIYSDYFAGFMGEVNAVVTDGENIANLERREIIKQETQSYILDKAVRLGADIAVEVTLSADDWPIPSGIIIKGAVSPYVKKVLTQYIEEQIGIPEEAQIWKQNTA